MPIAFALHVLPRDPSTPVPSIGAPELSTSLAQTWELWHASHTGPDDLDEADPREIEDRVRTLAQLQLELLWDELEQLGLPTGEIVDYEAFPSLIEGYRPRLLSVIS